MTKARTELRCPLLQAASLHSRLTLRCLRETPSGSVLLPPTTGGAGVMAIHGRHSDADRVSGNFSVFATRGRGGAAAGQVNGRLVARTDHDDPDARDTATTQLLLPARPVAA